MTRARTDGWCIGYRRNPHFADDLRKWRDGAKLCPACLRHARKDQR